MNMILRWIRIYQLCFTRMTGHHFSLRKRISDNSYLVLFLCCGRLTDYLPALYILLCKKAAQKSQWRQNAGVWIFSGIQKSLERMISWIFTRWGKNLSVVTQDDLSWNWINLSNYCEMSRDYSFGVWFVGIFFESVHV